MQTQQVGRRSSSKSGRKQGRSHKRIREPRGNCPQLTRTINQIEARSGLPFEQWIDRVTSNPVCALVKQEHADCFVINLVDITGRVLVEIPVKREFYNAIHAAVTARGVALHQFIVEAVETYCAQVSGGDTR